MEGCGLGGLANRLVKAWCRFQLAVNLDCSKSLLFCFLFVCLFDEVCDRSPGQDVRTSFDAMHSHQILSGSGCVQPFGARNSCSTERLF